MPEKRGCQRFLSDELAKTEGKGMELVFSNDGEFLSGMDVRSVFQPFYRCASGETPGSGLGLYVVKRIVEKYGGRINADVNEVGDFEVRIIF